MLDQNGPDTSDLAQIRCDFTCGEVTVMFSRLFEQQLCFGSDSEEVEHHFWKIYC